MVPGGHDYVIVGGGSAGCVLANRLSADPACRFALLEAGGPDRAREIRIPVGFIRLLQTGYDWAYPHDQAAAAGRPEGELDTGGRTADRLRASRSLA